MNEVVIAAIAATPGIGAAYFAYRKSRSAAEAATKQAAINVEAGAYERARKLYEDGIRQLEDQVQRLRQQVTDEQETSSNLRKKVSDMEETIATLRRQLINAGIDLAPRREQ